MSRTAASVRAAAAGITAAVTAVAASLLVVNQASAPATLPSSAHLATVPDTLCQDTQLEPECDCAPLWNCIERGEGGCGMLESKLRECMARNRKR